MNVKAEVIDHKCTNHGSTNPPSFPSARSRENFVSGCSAPSVFSRISNARRKFSLPRPREHESTSNHAPNGETGETMGTNIVLVREWQHARGATGSGDTNNRSSSNPHVWSIIFLFRHCSQRETTVPDDSQGPLLGLANRERHAERPNKAQIAYQRTKTQPARPFGTKPTRRPAS